MESISQRILIEKISMNVKAKKSYIKCFHKKSNERLSSKA
jgi:hypothetical protein